MKNRVCFPYSSIKFAERTHNGYLNRTDEDDIFSTQSHSILINLPKFNFVKSFSLDYIHRLCLGVMKKTFATLVD